ncbi:fructosamine kinase family protein [Kineosporia succinea]|uniref:Fructosamine-3-kinase n=1 Tax=Kineosporia succinea TaxID=84632 RepID=A0ABT9NZ60_9ACTN|nr:fructosamine kinase family protein [Kineosporia succinea]MDP9825728.1 fructosamine-3-kinase [Kineosporia succinea]
MEFTKRDPHAAEGFYQAEAAGLRWLGEAGDGLEVAEVLEVTDTSISLRRYETVSPDADQARILGRGLARTHRKGAPHHGSPPPGVRRGFIATLALPHLDEPPPHWGDFYARCRLEPFARAAHDSGALSEKGFRSVQKLCDRLTEGEHPEVPAARLHGDLWSGNVLWTRRGPVLIDPASHGGHPETDLAMLALFGLPHLETVLEAYTAENPLPEGWRERMPLHQLHPLLVHAVLFGASYGEQAARVADSCANAS